MPPMNEACPHDEATRAARCEGCCTANGALAPCVMAYFRGKLRPQASNVVSLHRVLARQSRPAA